MILAFIIATASSAWALFIFFVGRWCGLNEQFASRPPAAEGPPLYQEDASESDAQAVGAAGRVVTSITTRPGRRGGAS